MHNHIPGILHFSLVIFNAKYMPTANDCILNPMYHEMRTASFVAALICKYFHTSCFALP